MKTLSNKVKREENQTSLFLTFYIFFSLSLYKDIILYTKINDNNKEKMFVKCLKLSNTR